MQRICETTTALEANEYATSVEIDPAMDNICQQVTTAIQHRDNVLNETLKTQVQEHKMTLLTEVSELQAFYTTCQTIQI